MPAAQLAYREGPHISPSAPERSSPWPSWAPPCLTRTTRASIDSTTMPSGSRRDRTPAVVFFKIPRRMDKQRRLEWYRLGNTGEPPPSFKAHLVLSRLLAGSREERDFGRRGSSSRGLHWAYPPPPPCPPAPRPPAPPAPPHAHTYRHAHFTLAGGRHGMTQTASCQAVAAQPQAA